MNAAAGVAQIRVFLLVVQLLSKLQLSIAGTCWSAMVRNGRCTELLMESSTKEDCCEKNRDLATAWSEEEFDSGTLFFWRALGGGVPCSLCKETCSGVSCSDGKVCVVKGGRPKCACSPKCRRAKRPKGRGPVCGTDGRTYRSLCRLRKRACRKRTALTVAYYGACQSSCDRIVCSSGKQCLLDQNGSPHCVRCSRKCPPPSPARRQVCGSDGVTYPSACLLREAACKRGKAIPIAYKGGCTPSATCGKVRCSDRQQFCLRDFDSGLPRCITCTRRCPKYRHAPSGAGGGPICGSNNQTYHSWCYMVQDACAKGYTIETKYPGKCESLASD